MKVVNLAKIKILGNDFSINNDTTKKGTAKKSNFKGEASLKKVIIFNIIIYLKKESTNSFLLKTCKCSMPSPTPIYFTGI